MPKQRSRSHAFVGSWACEGTHPTPTSGATSPTDPGPVIQAAWDAAPEDIKNLAEKILREWIKSRELFRIGDLHAELAIRGYAFEEPPRYRLSATEASGRRANHHSRRWP